MLYSLWNDCVTSARAGYAVGWIAKLTVFNLVCEAVICGGWHICLYSGSAKQLSGSFVLSIALFIVRSAYVTAADPLRAVKFNKTEQYIPTDETRGILFASSHMDRHARALPSPSLHDTNRACYSGRSFSPPSAS